jgi:3',5'-cyclic AMP phosphodiesterase CpdA
VLERAGALGELDVVVASGDLSDDGSAESYRGLKELLEPWAAARGAIVVYAMGNHDDRAGFEEVLGDRVGIASVRGFRIIWLDSSVPGRGYGMLDSEQLAWLRSTLDAPAENGTLVVVHHPPVPASSALLAALELANPGELLDACRGGGVRAILSGHYHSAMASQAGGIPVFVAPGIANSSDPIAAEGTERATIGSGFCVVEVPMSGAPRAIFVAAPSDRDGEELFDLDATSVLRIAEEAGAAE